MTPQTTLSPELAFQNISNLLHTRTSFTGLEEARIAATSLTVIEIALKRPVENPKPEPESAKVPKTPRPAIPSPKSGD